VTIREEDYEGHKSYVCTKCRGMFQTFDKAEAKEHEDAGDHPYAKGAAGGPGEPVEEK
jgi:transposase-like protein